MAHRSDLRAAIGQLARLVGYEPTSEKINIRPLKVSLFTVRGCKCCFSCLLLF